MLAPHIIRQRLIIEFTCSRYPEIGQLFDFIPKLSKFIGMEIVYGPTLHLVPEKGHFVHTSWKNSGCFLYSYFDVNPLITVDCYTCLEFNVEDVIEYVKGYFANSILELEWKEA